MALLRGDLTPEAVERGAVATRTLDDGSVLDVVVQIFGTGMLGVIRPQHDGEGSYSDSWQYPTVLGAIAAMRAWDGEGEPTGWYRHPTTGRRRPGCDPSKEFVRE